MNQSRRNDIRAAEARLDALKPAFACIATLKGELESVKEELERLRDEEQDYLDNMPESLQSGEKGDIANEAINALDEATSEMDSLIDGLPDSDVLDTITGHTDTAKGAE